jgi:hypothetical protein
MLRCAKESAAVQRLGRAALALNSLHRTGTKERKNALGGRPLDLTALNKLNCFIPPEGRHQRQETAEAHRLKARTVPV